MEENNLTQAEQVQLKQMEEEEQGSSLDFATVYTTLVLNWKWFVLSLIICLGIAAIYLRYTTPVYQASGKVLIKDNIQYRRCSTLTQSTLGMRSTSEGVDNEMEVLTSHSLAQQTVRDLKLYVSYYAVGRVKDQILYRTQPINVDVDPAHVEKLNAPISLSIKRESGKYHVTGTYYVPVDESQAEGPFAIDKTISQLPATIGTRAGTISLTSNSMTPMEEGVEMKVFVRSPRQAAYKYRGALAVNQTGRTTSIVQLVLNDEKPQRALDYLQALAVSYNRQANDDKNEVAMRTEEFINGRLEKINAELGSTEGAIEAYKRSNRMVAYETSAATAASNSEAFSQRLVEANTQAALLDEMTAYISNPNNQYQPLPSNVGISDQGATSLINTYNQIVQKRNVLLQSASETSPTVQPLTQQLDELYTAIQRALRQSRRSMDIQRSAVVSQLGKYEGRVGQSPEQERILTQIGRQQEVKSGLYLMLLQKREENSISLAATADKGKLIDAPALVGQVSPKRQAILIVALAIALLLPTVILFLLQFFRYKIEGHADVQKLTTLPIIADVAVANDAVKTKADIVVHENKNNMMEEIFRSLRTNVQFMLGEKEKVIMFTSTTSGEGKTFIASNLAVSFALLGKRTLLVGLDIRKPRLAELFENNDNTHGITNLLTRDNVTWEDVQSQLLPSTVNNNLELLQAGPIPPNPTELVSRKSLEDIFVILRENYDYIIVDTAPVGLVTDTMQIGRIADMTVYMCRADYTAKESFQLINGLHHSNKLPKMAIVINGIDMSKKKYGYYYGYGKYGKYGRYARYGSGGYGKYGSYGTYGTYGTYGSYGSYSKSHYGDKNDNSIKQ